MDRDGLRMPTSRADHRALKVGDDKFRTTTIHPKSREHRYIPPIKGKVQGHVAN